MLPVLFSIESFLSLLTAEPHMQSLLMDSSFIPRFKAHFAVLGWLAAETEQTKRQLIASTGV